MRKFLFAILTLLTLTPSVSFAAALTQTQAVSLINVVQASPKTPASAFVNLITAFSNITVAQAQSLIGVVQSAPTVPANSFVNLLISFTQDSQTQPQQTFTTPSGAIIGADGTVLDAPASSNTSTSVVSSTNATPTLTITFGQKTITAAGATQGLPTNMNMTWDTNIPSDSKIFLTAADGTTQVIPSNSGNSTHHVIQTTLNANSQYSYTIEAIAGQQDQKINGSFTTPTPLVVNYIHQGYIAGNFTIELTTNVPLNPHLSKLVNTDPSGSSYSLDGNVQTAQQNSDGTYSYLWIPTQNFQNVTGVFNFVLTTSDGRTITSTLSLHR